MTRNLRTRQPGADTPTEGPRPIRPATGRQEPSTTTALLRAAGWSAVGGGLLLAADVVGHLFVDDTVTPVRLLGMPHELWHAPGVVGIVAALIGLIGIYFHQATPVGKLGRVGFVLLFVGVSMGAAYSTVFHAVFLPALEELQGGLFEEFVDAPVTVAQTVRGITVQAFGLGLGAILFGAATIRARVLPRLGGWLLIAAALLAAANEAFDAAQLISRVLFAAAFVVLGLALSSDRNNPDRMFMRRSDPNRGKIR